MKSRSLHIAGAVLLAVLITLVVWQGSFSFGMFGPSSASQTYLLWAVSTLIFILMVTLSFMLFRTGVKLYIERRKNLEGSRIKTKLVIGALALSIMPVTFMVLFSISVLNYNLNKWFSRPAENIKTHLLEVSGSFNQQVRLRAEAQARWLSRREEIGAAMQSGRPPELEEGFCRSAHLDEAFIEHGDATYWAICPAPDGVGPNPRTHSVRIPLPAAEGQTAELVVRAYTPVDLAATQALIDHEVGEYNQLAANRKETRSAYILLMLLICLFVLFVATWIALFFARQISGPIAALVEAAGELRKGNLRYRVQARGIDELGTLIRAFNEMTKDLEAYESELERRHSFTEAILESIPTAVISLGPDGRIRKVNRVLSKMFPPERVVRAERLEDLFPIEQAREIHYLTNRARRTGLAATQMELRLDPATLHLAVTVAALEGKHASGFVLVIEDTSELLRAQKAAAWHEVARRIAHEIKNPLTPIALSAERIGRQLNRAPGELVSRLPDLFRILGECSLTISAEVQTVKTLVDEFSQFARFPAAQPAPASLNDVVESALAVFSNRLDGITIHKQPGRDLPPVYVDREQFKRVVVNLVDNAAEAMQDCAEKVLTITTRALDSDAVELEIADTGHGISPEDRERLFLPYFSTKGRGTGLGLAIVHHILSDHEARIRAEENPGGGTRFVVEVPVYQPAPPDNAPAVAPVEAPLSAPGTSGPAREVQESRP